jgi:hypothetical protein
MRAASGAIRGMINDKNKEKVKKVTAMQPLYDIS